jgi:hypothetical protein
MVFLLKEADTKRRSIHGVPTKGSWYKEKKKKHPWCFLLKEADTKRRRNIHGVPTKGSWYKEKKHTKLDIYIFIIFKWHKGAVVVVNGDWIYNYLCNQYLSPLTCEFNTLSNYVYSIQHYVIKFVSDLLQVSDFLCVLHQ